MIKVNYGRLFLYYYSCFKYLSFSNKVFLKIKSLKKKKKKKHSRGLKKISRVGALKKADL